MSAPQCPECGRFMGSLGARNNRAYGYANAWYAVATCARHGEQGIDWDVWLGDFDPDALVSVLSSDHAAPHPQETTK